MEQAWEDDFVDFCFLVADLSGVVVITFGFVDGAEVAVEDGFGEDFGEDEMEVI